MTKPVKPMTLFKGLIPWDDEGPLDYWDGFSKGKRKYESSDVEKPGFEKNPAQSWWHRTYEVAYIWKDNEPFYASLTMDGYYRGRSAAGYAFKDESGQLYTMRLRCLEDLLMRSSIVNGKTSGWFGFVKQGSNYSLMLVRP